MAYQLDDTYIDFQVTRTPEYTKKYAREIINFLNSTVPELSYTIQKDYWQLLKRASWTIEESKELIRDLTRTMNAISPPNCSYRLNKKSNTYGFWIKKA